MSPKYSFLKAAAALILVFSMLSLTACSGETPESGGTGESPASLESSGASAASESSKPAAGEPTVPLDRFKTGEGEYQFGEIEWGISEDSVIAGLDFTVTEEAEKNEAVESGIGIKFYKSEDNFVLDNQTGYGELEFHDDKFAMLSFRFTHLDENYMQWYEAQKKKLIDIYGEPTDTQEQSKNGMNTLGCRWKTEKTTMQLVMMYGDAIKPSATLGVADIQLSSF